MDKDDEQFAKELEEYYAGLEDELLSFDILKLFQNNGRSVVNDFFDKLFKMLKQRANYLKRAADFYISSGEGDIKEKKRQGMQVVFEYLDLSKRYFISFLIHAAFVLKEQGEEDIKNSLSQFFEIYSKVLDDFLTEDQRFLFEVTGQNIVTDRTISLLNLQEQLKESDTDKRYETIKNYKPDEGEEKRTPLGSNALYMTFALAVGCMGEAFSHGQAFFTRYDPIRDIPNLILDLKDLLLKINETVPFLGHEIPGEFEFCLINCYLSPGVKLLEQVKLVYQHYIDKLDNGDYDDEEIEEE